MTLTAHSIVAAAIVSKVSNPVVGLPLVLVSHFVFDKLPHWDVMTNKDKNREQIIQGTVVDIVLGFVSAGIFFFVIRPGLNPAYFFSAVTLSQLPDWLEAPYVLPHIKNPVSTFAYSFQHFVHDLWFDARLEAPWGIVTQAIVCLVFLLWAAI